MSDFNQPESNTAPAPSPEQVAVLPSGIELAYQTFGSPTGEPLLLIMGLGGPMTWWDPQLCRRLAHAGFYVIRYDNRDTGVSSRVQGRVSRPQLVRAFLGRSVSAPYSIATMAQDAAQLLEVLSIGRAHILGMSMGGMIAQTFALEYPHRTASLTSIMSTTGRRSVGWQDPRLIPNLLRPARTDREGYIEAAVASWRLISSPDYPEPVAATRARAAQTWDRGINPDGVMRQMLAVVTQPDRTTALHQLRLPAAVIHGLADKMVHPSGGRATAAAIRDSSLLLLPGMGHDLPVELYPAFIDTIAQVASRA